MSGVAEATLDAVDEEVRRLIDECYQRAISLLREEQEATRRYRGGAPRARDARRSRGLRGRRDRPAVERAPKSGETTIGRLSESA